MGVQVIGFDRLNKNLATLAGTMQAKETRAIFVRAVRPLRATVRGEAPVNDGQLRKAIISFGSKRRGKRTEPAAFVRVNVLKGRVQARHAHLVEFGTGERRPKRGKVLRINDKRLVGIGGKSDFIFTRKARAVRANPFFQRGIAKGGSPALHQVETELTQLIFRRALGAGSSD